MCQKRNARIAQQIMAPLPLNKLTTSLRAFAKVAVDFGGSFMTIYTRNGEAEAGNTCVYSRAWLQELYILK